MHSLCLPSPWPKSGRSTTSWTARPSPSRWAAAGWQVYLSDGGGGVKHKSCAALAPLCNSPCKRAGIAAGHGRPGKRRACSSDGAAAAVGCLPVRLCACSALRLSRKIQNCWPLRSCCAVWVNYFCVAHRSPPTLYPPVLPLASECSSAASTPAVRMKKNNRDYACH